MSEQSQVQPSAVMRATVVEVHRQSASRRIGYIPAFDGLRAPAVGLVMAHHAHVINGGFVGVDVFFVLSGFLITTLLVREHAATDRISLRGFYTRRARRLVPALVLVCAFVLVAYGLDVNNAKRGDTLLGVVSALGYASSWVMASGASTLGQMASTWSLSVEEYFYVAWPLVMITALRRWSTRVAWVVAGFALAAVAYRLGAVFLLDLSKQRLYFSPDLRAEQLLIGCLAAVVYERTRFRLPRHWLTVALVAFAIGGIALYALQAQVYWSPAYQNGGSTLIAGATVLIVAWVYQFPGSALSRVLSVSPLVWIGKRAYGLYLWHLPLFGLIDPRIDSKAVFFTVGCALTFLFAAVSYRWVEQPVLRGRWPSKREVAVAESPPAAAPATV